MLDLSRFTAAQRAAVTAPDGPLVIIAGPGSGKTTVIAARIAYLVAAREIPPSSILALTFTTAAARELRARLVGVLGDAGRAVDGMTFHAFGLRVIRAWSEALGFGPGLVVVYGEHDARALVKEAAQMAGIDLDRWSPDQLAAAIQRVRVGAVAPDEEALRLVVPAYEQLLRRRGAVDYAAMLALPLRLFGERPEALQLFQDAYRHILCDEAQDICGGQYALLRLLAKRHRNLVMVGDPAQTIFGWRGADVGFLLGFERDFPGAQLLSLDESFRATGHMVELANALASPLTYGRRLRTRNPPGERAMLFVGGDEPAEAALVAREIERLAAEGLVGGYGEIAVLYRTNDQARELAVALRARRLPYRVRGNGDLFARREVRDALAYLRLAHNPTDVAALARIVNSPPRRLGRLAESVRSQPVALGDVPGVAAHFGPPARASAEALVRLVHDLHQASADLGPAPLLDLVLERSGYRDWVGRLSDGPGRLTGLTALRALAERSGDDLGDWLAELQLGEETQETSASRGWVLLTTIHGAKGAEWRVVFVVGVEEGLLPHAHALVARESADPSAPQGVAGGLEEELRVAYVAVTRPRERLYLSWCRQRHRGDRVESRAPSRFLQALPGELLARAA